MKKTLRKLKTTALAAALLAMPSVAMAQITTSDRFTISELQNADGLYYFNVGLQGSQDYCAYNMTITLPIGMSFTHSGGDMYIDVVMDEDSEVYPFTKTLGKKSFPHSVAGATPHHPYEAKVICTSQTNAVFTSQVGNLYSVAVEYNAWTKAGENTVSMTGLNLTANENIDGTLTAVKYVPEGDLNTGTITIPAEGREVEISISETAKFGTCILPFNKSDLPEGITAYKAVGIEDNVLKLVSVDEMEAYKPYILYAPEGFSATWSGVADEAAFPNAAMVQDNGLCGVLIQTSVSAGYILQNLGEGAQFYRVGDTPFSLKAGRCYLMAEAGQNVRMCFLGGEEVAIAPVSAQQHDAWFNLQGQRIAAPTQHGVYIYNGKKILK